MEFSKSRARFRNWALGQSADAGAWGRDEIRNMTGHMGSNGYAMSACAADNKNYGTGVFSKTVLGTGRAAGDAPANGLAIKNFDASCAVPTGPLNVPPHIWQPVILYLGWPK